MVGREVPAEVAKPADEKVRFIPASEQRFQSAQHDADNFGAKRPVGTQHIPHGATGFSKVVQDITGVTAGDLKNSGISTFDTGEVLRADTPNWIRDPKMLDEYFERRSDLRSGFKITRALDRFILEDYFLSNHTDEIIFQEHESSFDEERRVLGRKSRWTSSQDAVKHRRERLLRDRERFYEPPKTWTRSSWRGILVSTASGEWGAIELHGIVTTKRKRKASKIADYYGLVGRFQEPPEIIADAVFDDSLAVDLWMSDHGIARDEVIIDDRKWR
jgi:hypothetical protein